MPKINNTELLEATGLRVVHCRPREAFGGRGMTLAYRPTNRGAVEVATAVCKNGDTFCKKIGTETAVNNFVEGKTVFLPVDRRISGKELGTLIEMFRYW